MTVYPLYCLTNSDSQGEGFNFDFFPQNLDAIYSDLYTGPLTDVWIWNQTNTEWQILQHEVADPANQNNLSNSQEPLVLPGSTVDENGPAVGPEMSLGYHLQQLHGGPVFLFKYCRNSSVAGVLPADNIEWSPASGDTTKLFDKVWDTTTGRVKLASDTALTQSGGGFPSDVTGLELRAVFSVLGSNDAGDATNTANFGANLKLIIDTTRSRIATLGIGTTLHNPIPYVVSMTNPGIVFSSNVEDIRAAQFAARADRANVLLAETEFLPLAVDNLHFNSDVQIEHGALLARTYRTFLEGTFKGAGVVASPGPLTGLVSSPRAEQGALSSPRTEVGRVKSGRVQS